MLTQKNLNPTTLTHRLTRRLVRWLVRGWLVRSLVGQITLK